MIFDSHCHASPQWFEPVELLLFQMDRNGVERAALVQLLGQYDNAYQNTCVAKYPDRLVSVVAVDWARPDGVDRLKEMIQSGAAGVRLRPEARSPGDDPYAIWRLAAEHRLSVSCVGLAANFTADAFAELVQAVPTLPIVMEHLGGWARPDCDGRDETRQAIAELARFPNLHLKLPSLGQLVQRARDLPATGPVLDPSGAGIVLEMLDHFGPDRMMWGSDHPVVSSREGYANALGGTRALFADAPSNVTAKVFGAAAESLFGMRRP
jgi:L-fuconolactonase